MNFTLQNPRVRSNFPVITKDPVSKIPKSASIPVPKSTPKPNVPNSNKCQSTSVTRNIVTTCSGHVVKPPNKLNL